MVEKEGHVFPSLFLFLFLFFSIIFLFSSRFLFLFFGILFVGFLVFFRFVILACSFFLLVFFFCFPEFSFLFFCVSNTRALPCLMLMFFFAIPKSSESLTAKPSSRQRYVGRNLRFRRIEALHFATMTHNQNSRRDFKPHFQWRAEFSKKPNKHFSDSSSKILSLLDFDWAFWCLSSRAIQFAIPVLWMIN